MQGKKIIISALIVIAGGFIGFLSGLLIKVDKEYNFKIDFTVENQIPGVEINLNGQIIGEIDSSGYKDFSQLVKQNSSLKFSFKKPGCIVVPEEKRYLVTNNSENNHLILKLYPDKTPKLMVSVRDWRGRKIPDAQIFINDKPLKIKSNHNGLAVIPLNGVILGTVLKLDAKYGKMYPLKGNDDIVISEGQYKFDRNIVLYQRPENWVEFSITSNGNPVKNARIIRDGKKIQITRRNNKYLDWLHEINQTYAYTIYASGYEGKKIKVTPTQKGRNEWNISLDKLQFNLRIKDKTGLSESMEDVIIYNSKNREIARTNSLGMAVNLPFYSLNRSQIFYAEKKPDFHKQKIVLKISKNNANLTAYIEPFSYKRYVSVVWENGKPATNTLLRLNDSNGFIQEVKLDRKGRAVFDDPKIKPNRDYTITVKTEFGEKDVIDSPTEYELENKSRKKIIFTRKGTLNVRLTGGRGAIEIYDTKNNRVAKGVSPLHQILQFDNYIIKVKGTETEQRRNVAFYEENKEIIIDLTDPCEKIMTKINKQADFLNTNSGQDELEDVYNQIDDKIASGNTRLTDCEAQVVRMYADIKYNAREYYPSMGAYDLLLKNVKGADRKAVNIQRYGKSNLYYAMAASITTKEKDSYIEEALKYFRMAETKIAQSINKKFRRKFTTELYFDKAEAMNKKYELVKMYQESNSGLYKKKAKDAWDSFLFQYSKCNPQLQNELSEMKRIADRRLMDLR